MINMKNYNKLWLSAVALFMMASCAEDSKLDFMVEKPESLAQLEYLNDYDVLKSYVDRTANPDFKLGAGVSVEDFTAKLRGYSLIYTNFDEVTAGWEMKHGGVVRDDGSLNMANVKSLIKTAKEAGISVYGHTLVWHANQNAKYLNKTIAPVMNSGPVWDVMAENNFETSSETFYSANANAIKGFTADGEGYNGVGRALTITNTTVRANDYECQLFITFPTATVKGQQYTLEMDIRSDVAATYPTQAQTAPGAYKHWNFFGQLSSPTAWFHFSETITIDDNTAGCTTIALNLGKTATTFYFDNMKVTKLRPAGATYNLISGADFESDAKTNYQSNANAVQSFTAVGEGANGTGRALKITNSEVRANDYGSQFFLTFAPSMQVGERYKLTMDVRADVACSFGTQAHVVPYTYKHWDFFGSISATTTWKQFEKEITITEQTATTGAIAFNLGLTATSYYFDNIKLTKYSPGGIERTPEEKKQIITEEMKRWINGMMDVSKDYVKAWDVVNEPMDDGKPNQLKTGVGKTDIKADEFYWQDYLGKDYAVEAFKLAAQYGNPGDKLFINDYNLEYSIDKCKGLIEYVAYIEGKGARVDGIGTQMHISTTSDKNKIIEMFTLLAQTGKLIKISELDLGIDNKKTENCTDADYQAQAEMYKFVVQKYFELIPAAQRYGITFWSPLDSPAGSGWRAGEPIGLWNKNYSRKRAYGAAADAFAGK